MHPDIKADIGYLSKFSRDTHIIIFMASTQLRTHNKQKMKRQLIKSWPSVNHEVETASVDISFNPDGIKLNLHGILG